MWKNFKSFTYMICLYLLCLFGKNQEKTRKEGIGKCGWYKRQKGGMHVYMYWLKVYYTILLMVVYYTCYMYTNTFSMHASKNCILYMYSIHAFKSYIIYLLLFTGFGITNLFSVKLKPAHLLLLTCKCDYVKHMNCL